MSSTLRLSVLGQPRVELAGRTNIAFVSARSQALLLYLAVTKQIHSRETLAALLWPTKSQDLARHNLRDVLTKLRPFFGDFFAITRNTIGWNLTADHWLDADELEEQVAQAGQYSSLEELQSALKLYRGDFLADFFIEESNEFERWIIEQREKYKNIALRGFTLLLDRLTRQNDLPEAITVARRLLAIDPLHEEGNRQLLFLLGSSGQRIAALQHYERYTHILDDELGVEPSSELSELHLRLLRDEIPPLNQTSPAQNGAPTVPASPTLATPAPAAPVFATAASLHKAESSPPNNLPRTMTPFLGRKEEISAIQERLSSSSCSLVTIVGEGGMGKSRLALAVSEAVMPLFEDGVWFVPLTEIQPGAAAESRIAAAIGRALNLPFVNTENLTDQLFTYLRNRKSLLVLDNFEHLIEAAGFVLELLRAAPQVRLLISSRQRLNFQTESVFRLSGLPTPPQQVADGRAINDLMSYDSIALFVERAQRVLWKFRLSDSNAAAISRICQFVEGMPLAIELAASAVDILSPQEISRRLETDYKVLESPVLDLSTRQQSVQSLLDYSWQFLKPHEQKVLARCALFAGGFTSQAAAQVIESDFHTLNALEQKSLLRRDEHGRFDMHELVRQHAAENLRQHFSDEDEILLRHCEYFSHFVSAREASLGNDSVTFHELSIELANIQQAWHYAVSRAQIKQISQCRQGLFSLYNLSGLSYEAESTLRIAIARVRVVLKTCAPEVANAWQQLLAELLIDVANICEVLGKLAEAEQFTNETIEIAERIDNDALLAHGYMRVSANAWARGDYGLHRQALNRSLELAQTTRQFFVEANAFCGLGNNDAIHNMQDDALMHYSQALLIARANGFRQLENMLVSNVGVIHQLHGNFTQARENFLRSLQVSIELGDRYGAALAEINLGVLANMLGEPLKAMERLLQALTTFQEIGSQRMEAEVLVNLALTHHYMGDQVQAIYCCKQAIAIDQSHQFLYIDSPAHLNLGRSFEAMEQIHSAKSEYQKVLDLQTEDSPANNAIIAQAGLARLAFRQGNLTEAMAQIEQILPRLFSSELYAGPDETEVCLTTYRILHATNDPRALAILIKGAENVLQQMNSIDDFELRRTFVNNIAVRKELLALARTEAGLEFDLY